MSSTPAELADEHEAQTGHVVIGDDLGYVCQDCVWTSHGEDKRLSHLGLCRVTTMLGAREFICLQVAHSEPPRLGHGHRSTQLGSSGLAPRSERHYFVRRYPYGDH